MQCTGLSLKIQEHSSSKRFEFGSKKVTIPSPYSVERRLIAIPSMVDAKQRLFLNSCVRKESSQPNVPKKNC